MYLSLVSLNLELRTHEHETALWLSLMQLDSDYLSNEDITEYEHTFATRLIKRGANPDSIESRTGNSLLHKAALKSNEAAAVFLVHHGAIPNSKNNEGEAPIHIAARNGLDQLVKVLLQNGADPNLQTAVKPKQAPPPLTLPPAEAESRSNPSTAASSMTRLDDFAAAGTQVGGGMMSPTTLGALSALSTVTSQVREREREYKREIDDLMSKRKARERKREREREKRESLTVLGALLLSAYMCIFLLFVVICAFQPVSLYIFMPHVRCTCTLL